MKTFALITSAFVLSGSVFSVVEAASPSDLLTAVVKFGDLDATRPAGKEELYRRLTVAAHSVCRLLEPSDLQSRSQLMPMYKACLDKAVSGAVSKINRPEFTDYVASRIQKSDHARIQLAAG